MNFQIILFAFDLVLIFYLLWQLNIAYIFKIIRVIAIRSEIIAKKFINFRIMMLK